MATESACFTSALPFVYDSPGEARDVLREVGGSARHTVAEVSQGNQFNAKDRADQDRYLAGEFRGLGVQSAHQAERAQKDRTDDSRWDCLRAEGLSKDIERNGRSAELATEKTAAATILAIEKTAAATNLAIQAARAEAAKCCCETEARIAASTAAILAAMKDSEAAELRRQLTVYQVRAVAGTGSSPV